MSITKSSILSFNEFRRLRNPGAGPGQVFPTVYIDNLLSAGIKFLEIDAKGTGGSNTNILPKALTKKSDKISFEAADMRLIIDKPGTIGGLINQNLKAPINFTFYLAFINGKKDVLFSVRFPIDDDNNPGQTTDVYFNISTNNYPAEKPVKPVNPGAYASEDAACKTIAAAHSISPAVFQQSLDTFWGDYQVPKPYLAVWDVFSSFLDDAGEDSLVKIVWQDDDLQTNDMDFGVEEQLEKELMVKTDYTVLLFRGINSCNPSGELRFYKGINGDNTKTILIENVALNGTHSYYDLSNDRP